MSKRQERDIIAIIGRTNAGKSSLLNLLSGQKDYAIVDKTPGTTTDTVAALMEIHGLGPCKILDTAGADEYTKLGRKKRAKTFEAIEEADVSLIVLNARKNKKLSVELELIKRIKQNKKQGLVILNNFGREKISKGDTEKIEQKFNCPVLAIKANYPPDQGRLVDFIKKNYQKESSEVDLFPNLANRGFALLVIPMDEETPAMRLLRPQDMALERILRKFAIPVLFRLDLLKARQENPDLANSEYKRFRSLIDLLKNSGEGLQFVITDSQALDIVPKWTPEEIALTSFSIMMAHYMSQGNLALMLEGAKAINGLRAGSKILVAEACNHDRKCDDIGTVQIPRILEKKVGGKLNFDFNFGRPFPKNLRQYDLIIHCGACMIDRQKFSRRLLKTREGKVPIINYGMCLAFAQDIKTLERAILPFSNKKICLSRKNKLKYNHS